MGVRKLKVTIMLRNYRCPRVFVAQSPSTKNAFIPYKLDLATSWAFGSGSASEIAAGDTWK